MKTKDTVMKEHNMKRLVVLLAVMLLSFGLTNAANQVTITHNMGDTIWQGQAGWFIVSYENDVKLGGVSNGFKITSTDGVTWTYDEAGGFAISSGNLAGPKFVKGIAGSRWMAGPGADGSCWDLGGTLINNSLVPAQFLVGGAALGAGLNAGPLQPMLEFHVTAGGMTQGQPPEFLCIDSAFFPPAGSFIFVDAAGPSIIPGFTGGCFPTKVQDDPCPVWNQANPTAMTVSHCGPGKSVTLSATDGPPNPSTVQYYLVGMTGGNGVATVGQLTGVVTYVPDINDVGLAIAIEVEATDAAHQQGGCLGETWIVNVTVTNVLPTVDCGAEYNPVGKGNPVVKNDIVGGDTDPCDVLIYSVALVGTNDPDGPTGTFDIVPGTGVFTFNTDQTDGGFWYDFEVTVTDGFAEATCTFRVDVLVVEPWEVQIEKTHQTIQGHYVDIDLTLNKGSETMGGFDFLIGYDASALAFTEASLGQYFVDCGWEYFTYRFNWNGNCGNACPSGLVRIVGLAETNNGPNHPDMECIQLGVDQVIATLTFFLSNDRTLECMYAPIRFYWMDCGDNTISTIYGDTLAMNRFIYEYEGDEIQDYGYGFPGFVGAPNYCLEGDKVTPVRFIDFINGGVDIVCGDSIDARGDINVNGVANEIADAVMFTNYFISGLSAFGTHIDASIAASDVNADGIALSVADLVYQIRVLVGDANPYPKPMPEAQAVVNAQAGAVSVNAPVSLGAALLTFQVNGEIGTPVLGVDMDMKYAVEGNELRVLIYNIGRKSIPAGENTLVTVPGNVELTGVEVASYEGAVVDAMINRIPVDFALKNYPNPFNPATTISLSLPVESDWTIEVFNVAGQLVREYSGHSQAGTTSVIWDGSDNNGKSVASGIYFYRANADQFSQTKKMMLMK